MMGKNKEKEYVKRYNHKSESKSEASVTDRRKNIGLHLNFAASEAYKLLRTNLVFSMADENTCKVIGVTSALRGEGKSTTSINLAYTFAQSGKQVLLVEADMRIPVVASVLRLEETPGLSHVLAGIGTLNDAVRPSNLLRGLFILTSGEIPPNPSELLSSKRFEKVVKTLSDAFEYIIIDLPPINAVSDSLAVSKLLTGMLVVVRQNYCDQPSLAEAMRRMEMLQVKVLGFVLNGSESDEKRYKKYGGYRYGRSGKYGRGYAYGYAKKTKDADIPVDDTDADVSFGNINPESKRKNDQSV